MPGILAARSVHGILASSAAILASESCLALEADVARMSLMMKKAPKPTIATATRITAVSRAIGPHERCWVTLTGVIGRRPLPPPAGGLAPPPDLGPLGRAEPPGLPPVAVDLPDLTTLTCRFSPGELMLIDGLCKGCGTVRKQGDGSVTARQSPESS